ncbi:MAG: trypsin-like peptidase domain-containing protein [Planctomycetota bacterium]|nr:trypsin-like peptidase domain-containing protein [Planctomycetota bacterium]
MAVIRNLIIFAVAFGSFHWATAACASDLRQTAVVKAVRQAAPSVVNIRGEKRVTGVGNDESGRRVNGMGTGVVLDPRGYIITNHHVVDGVREIQVTLDAGERYVAQLIARDPETDLAIIKIDCPRKLKVVNLGSSDDLMTGEPVIAVGNAFGYEHTVTRGIISSLHRAVQVSDAQYYSDLIQTDASINPGNSGGALLNIDGEMIGIVVAVRAGAQGIGFAIPIDKAISVATNMLSSRNGSNSLHGMTLVCAANKTRNVKKPSVSDNTLPTDDKDDSSSQNAPQKHTRGVFVTAVDDKSPAAKAGLKPGDLVTKVDDLQITRGLDFQRALLGRAAGDRLTIELERDGKVVESELTLSAAAGAKSRRASSWQVLGLELKRISPEQFQKKYKTRYRGGLAVAAVRANSPAAAQGIHKGDVLVGMHIWETVSLDNISYILKRLDLNKKDPVKFFILRGGETLYGHMSLATRRTASR